MDHFCALTTFDNPYDPIEQFDLWNMFDIEKGYYSCSKLDRIVKTTIDMTDTEMWNEVERAIDEIITHDFTNTFRKVTKNIEQTGTADAE